MYPSLLNIPTEIRLQIYGYCVPLEAPLSLPYQDWLGLVHTCRAIKAELEPEICKGIANCIEAVAVSIRDSGDEIIYNPPITVGRWLNLSVSRPKIKDMFTKDDPFLKFQYFYFKTFTVTFHNDATGYEYYKGRPNTYQSAAANLAREIGKWYKRDAYPAMGKWVLDWSKYPQSKQRNMYEGLYARQRDAWEMDTRYDYQGFLTGVCFRRQPVAKTWETWLEEREKERANVEREVARRQARGNDEAHKTFLLDESE